MTDTTNPAADDDFDPNAQGVVDDQNIDQTNDQSDDDDDQQDADAEGSQEDELEYDEVERNGKKYRIPKDLAPELMLQSDYTRKTQALSEERKALEASVASFKGAAKEIDDKAFELKALDRRLSDLTGLTPTDWQEIARLDQINGTNNYDRLNRELVTLPRQREGLAGELKAKEDEVLSQQRATLEKQWEEGQAVLARDIKGWGPELAEKLVKTATTDFGFTEQEARSLTDPRWIKVFHEAHQHREATRKARVQTTADKATKVTPIAGVKGATVPKTGLSDELSSDEWFKRERTQRLAKAAAPIRR